MEGRLIRALTILAFCLGMSASIGSARAKDLVVTDVRIAVAGAQTRIVLNLSDAAQIETFTLTAPYRLVVNLPDTVWKLPANWQKTKGGVVKSFRFGRLGPGRSRLIFDLTGPAKLTENITLPPQGERRYRLVLDLSPATAAEFQKSAGWPPGEAAGALGGDLAAPKPPPKRAKKLICLDPGHGGIDPGATGVSGALEKDIVLAAALEFRETLRRSGRYQVAMTRDTDVFLSLKARVAVCRSKSADLMISIHADSAGGAVTAKGATIYTLSEKASDAEAEELAQSENQSDTIAGVDIGQEDDVVSSILIELAQRDTKSNSVRFAKALAPELEKTGRSMQRSHKFAGFRVLKAPDVPSVLLEMGYITNADEELQLKSETWRRQLAQAVLRSLDSYFAVKPAAAP
jgi:N-acetylmuramoyl-L-alanine amidase